MRVTNGQLRRIIREERTKLQESQRPEQYFGIEDKLVNLLLDMEGLSTDQLEDMISRLTGPGIQEVIKLLAEMALEHHNSQQSGRAMP